MATRYSYPIDLHEEREGGFSVTFPDFDEAFTDGDTLAEAVAEAGDCLEEALAGRIARREDIPVPSPAKGRPAAVPGAVLAAKAALYEAPARRAAVQQRLRDGHGHSGKRGSPHARSPPRHQDRKAGGSFGPLQEAPGSHRGGSRLTVDRRWQGVRSYCSDCFYIRCPAGGVSPASRAAASGSKRRAFRANCRIDTRYRSAGRIWYAQKTTIREGKG